MSILLCNEELERLAGLPHAAIVLYVLAIRPRMDIRSGKVGIKPRISWQALAEWVFIEPHQGLASGRPSKSALRRAAGWLERAGLIEMQSSMEDKTLVFWCKKAETLSLVQNKADTNPTQKPDMPEALQNKALGHTSDTKPTGKADTHRREELTTSTQSSSSSTEPMEGTGPRERGRVGTPDYRPPQGGAEGPQGAYSTVPGLNDLFQDQAPQKASSEGEGIFWPAGLNDDQREAIAAKTRHLGNRRQMVIDELSGFMARQTNPVENPVRYIDFLVKNASFPLWIPEHAGRIRAGREREAKIQALRPPLPSAAVPMVKNPAAAAGLTEILKPRKAHA